MSNGPAHKLATAAFSGLIVFLVLGEPLASTANPIQPAEPLLWTFLASLVTGGLAAFKRRIVYLVLFLGMSVAGYAYSLAAAAGGPPALLEKHPWALGAVGMAYVELWLRLRREDSLPLEGAKPGAPGLAPGVVRPLSPPGPLGHFAFKAKLAWSRLGRFFVVAAVLAFSYYASTQAHGWLLELSEAQTIPLISGLTESSLLLRVYALILLATAALLASASFAASKVYGELFTTPRELELLGRELINSLEAEWAAAAGPSRGPQASRLHKNPLLSVFLSDKASLLLLALALLTLAGSAVSAPPEPEASISSLLEARELPDLVRLFGWMEKSVNDLGVRAEVFLDRAEFAFRGFFG